MTVYKSKHVRVIDGPLGRQARMWVRHPEMVDDKAIEQIRSMLQSPNLFGHIAVMPDVHWGMGASIGSVMALEEAVTPNCVGVDIGCGMAAHPLGMRYASELKERGFWREWLGKVKREIPTGFSCHNAHSDRMNLLKLSARLERGDAAGIESLKCSTSIPSAKKFDSLSEMALRQQGTMGGGNHFIEIQRDQDDNLWIMVHSGSRNIGFQIANHYAKLAMVENARLGQESAPHLNWLSLAEPSGQAYMHDMQWAVDYALLNRKEMLKVAMAALDVQFEHEKLINIPHNYAAREEHFGKEVVVHRKGATSARVGELGIIPGSMGTPSYIVRGLGNEESYSSCSHGAGRSMGRKAARRALDTNKFANAISHTFTKPSEGYLDEAPQAYKNIDLVVGAQDELVEVVHKLEPIITLKDGQGSVD